MRIRLHQIVLISGATVTFMLAVALIISTGLPQRTTFTGAQIAGEFVAPERNSFAPNIDKITLAGETVNLQNLRGAPVIINFWATWCAPCRVEMPILQSLYDTYRNDGLRIIAVNMGEPPPIVSSWVNEFSFSYDVVLDTDGTLFNRYQVRGQPSTFIISPTGIISHVFYGPVPERQLNEALTDFFTN